MRTLLVASLLALAGCVTSIPTDAGVDMNTPDLAGCTTGFCCCNGDVAYTVSCVSGAPTCGMGGTLFSGSQCLATTCGGPCAIACPMDAGHD